MNKTFLIGHLTRDPEVTTTPSGISVCKFTLAVNRTYTNANGEREADFLNIVAWRGVAENCGKFLNKGSRVAICGEIQTRSYDTQDGQKRTVTEIMAQDVEFLSKPTEQPLERQQTDYTAPPKQKAELKPVQDEGLPF